MSSKFLSPELKNEIGTLYVNNGGTSVQLGKHFGVSDKCVRYYGQKIRNHSPFHKRKGRPSRIDSEFIPEIISKIKTTRIAIREDKYMDLIVEAIEKTNLKYNIPSCDNIRISRNCLIALESKLDIKTPNAEVGTHARIEACRDIRHMSSFAALCLYCNRITNNDANLICNADGTTFTVGRNLKSTTKCKIIATKTDGKSYKVGPEENTSSTGLFTIKMYFLVFANGLNGPLIFIIEDSALTKGTWHYHKVPGLGLGVTTDSNFGYVLFVEARNLTESFYEWFLKSILVPMCNDIKSTTDTDIHNTVFFKEDGEGIQIACLMNPGIRKYLKDNNIVLAKSAASTTEIQQELDAHNFFKAPKARLAAMTNDKVVKKYIKLKVKLLGVWKLHQDERNWFISL